MAFHCLPSIGTQVEQHLMELGRVGSDTRRIAIQMHRDFNTGWQCGTQQMHDFYYEFSQLQDFNDGFARSRKRKYLPDQLTRARTRFTNFAQA
jgi:hypothetical protein